MAMTARARWCEFHLGQRQPNAVHKAAGWRLVVVGHVLFRGMLAHPPSSDAGGRSGEGSTFDNEHVFASGERSVMQLSDLRSVWRR
jgi:hypothetical protein